MCKTVVSVNNPGLLVNWNKEKLEDVVIWGQILEKMSLSSNLDVVVRLEIGF